MLPLSFRCLAVLVTGGGREPERLFHIKIIKRFGGKKEFILTKFPELRIKRGDSLADKRQRRRSIQDGECLQA